MQVGQWHGLGWNPHLLVLSVVFFAFSLSFLCLTWEIPGDEDIGDGLWREGEFLRLFTSKHRFPISIVF
jgi:hypothetical protein